MADIFTQSSAYQGTFVPGTVDVDPVFQICAVANINASNQLEISFWINQNGERVDSNLNDAQYLIRDKSGTAVSGMSETGIAADVNGYYHTTPVAAPLLYDLTHFILEIAIDVDGVEKTASIGLVRGE